MYCGGCGLALGEDVAGVAPAFGAATAEGKPFIGTFTFGEQGCFATGPPRAVNRHGNLMFACAVFGPVR